jgi:hypothetical protein
MFCAMNSLTVNQKKSEVVVFNEAPADVSFQYGGLPLEVKDEFVYLGMLFNKDSSMVLAGKCRFDKGRRTRWAVTRHCYEQGINNVYVRCRLFDALVRPILSFGCEVWGPAFMTASRVADADRLQLAFIKHSLGVRTSTPTLSIRSELGFSSISDGWLKQILGFYNKIWARPESDLVRIALTESVSYRERSMWGSQLNRVIHRMTDKQSTDYLDSIGKFDIDSLLKDKRMKEMGALFKDAKDLLLKQGGVRSVTTEHSRGFKCFVYYRWFSQDGEEHRVHFDSIDRLARKDRFWFHLDRRNQIQAVARFRLGAHWLPIETGRFDRIARDQRYCPHCDHEAIGDEWHLFQCPRFQEFRDKYDHLFRGIASLNNSVDDAFRSFMNPTPQGRETKVFWENFAAFLLQCWWVYQTDG